MSGIFSSARPLENERRRPAENGTPDGVGHGLNRGRLQIKGAQDLVLHLRLPDRIQDGPVDLIDKLTPAYGINVLDYVLRQGTLKLLDLRTARRWIVG